MSTKFIASTNDENAIDYHSKRAKIAKIIIARLIEFGGSIQEMQKHFSAGGEVARDKYVTSIIPEQEALNLLSQFNKVPKP